MIRKNIADTLTVLWRNYNPHNKLRIYDLSRIVKVSPISLFNLLKARSTHKKVTAKGLRRVFEEFGSEIVFHSKDGDPWADLSSKLEELYEEGARFLMN